ncbi:hypothetical protein [Streptomyces umbrinus]|uniref:hypothetical protein n=1 Tax=Streptomyces umbrinus TaxID=67370 RepID=UPI0034468086
MMKTRVKIIVLLALLAVTLGLLTYVNLQHIRDVPSAAGMRMPSLDSVPVTPHSALEAPGQGGWSR